MARLGYMQRGFLTVPSGWKWDNYDASGATLTEAGPHAGGALTPPSTSSRCTLVTSGAQDDELTAYVEGGGMPTQLRALLKATGAADTTYIGRDGPSCLQDCQSLVYGATSHKATAAATKATTQEVMAVYASTTYIKVRLYDPQTDTWAAAVTVHTWSVTHPTVGVAHIPDLDRWVIIAVGNGGPENFGLMFYSTDDGANWTKGSDRCLPERVYADTDVPNSTLLYMGSDLVFITHGDYSGTFTSYILVSSSLGQSFSVMDDTDDTYDTTVGVVCPSGRVITASILTADSEIYISRAGLAQSVGHGASTGVDGTAVADIAIWATMAGEVYIMGRDSTYPDRWYLWRSDDEGESWVQSSYAPIDTQDAACHPVLLAPVSYLGGWMLIAAGENDTDAANERSIWATRYSGWSGVTARADSTSDLGEVDDARIGHGYTALSGQQSLSWWTAMGVPTSLTGATVAGAATVSASGARFVGVGCYVGLTPATNDDCLVHVAFTDATVGNSGSDMGIKIQIPFSGGGVDLEVRCYDSGVLVFDNNGLATLGSQLFDTSTPFEVVVGVNGLAVYVAWRRPGATAWTEVADATATNGAPGASLVVVGTNAVARVLQARAIGMWVGQSTKVWGASTDDHSDLIGCPLPAALPWWDSDDEVTVLDVLSGPGMAGEEHTSEPAYDYPVEAIFWDRGLSRSQVWRSTSDASQVIIPVDLTYDTSLGSESPGLYVSRATQRYVKLAGWTGAAWTTLVTVDLATGFTGLGGTLTGDTLAPKTGTAAGARYIYEDEFVGGTAKITDGVDTAWVPILANTSGVWREGAGKAATFQLDIANAGGTVPAGAITDLELWSPAGVAVAHDVTTLYDQYAIVIDAQDTPGDHFQLGLCLPGAFRPVGRQWSRNYGREHYPNISIERASDGTLYTHDLGDAYQTWRVSWAEGVDQSALQLASPNPDYYSTTGGNAQVNAADAPEWVVRALATHRPVVVLPSIPEAGATVTDPTLYLAGVVAGAPLQVDHVVGSEGESEVLRVLTVPVEGL